MEYVKLKLHVLKNIIKKMVNVQDVLHNVFYVQNIVIVLDVLKVLKLHKINYNRLFVEINVEMVKNIVVNVMMEIN